MGIRELRRTIEKERKYIVRRFIKQQRRNLIAKPGVNEIIIVLDNLSPLFNIGKIFRSAEAFGVQEVHVIATEFFDPAPAKGSFKYVPAKFFVDFDESYHALIHQGFSLFTLDSSGGSSLYSLAMPRKSAFIFGNEKEGLSVNLEKFNQIKPVHIPQYGQVESLNVSNVAAIVMYEYVRQHGAVSSGKNLQVSP
jgi:tRNA G18 (ribose-2'-O)-methylase SpoU